MHLLLTDRLTCPRCGPEFGLILLAHEVRDRRILRGDFGCSNCRETYPVEGGFGDLRTPPRSPLSRLQPGPAVVGDRPTTPDEEEGERGEALRIAAFMGVSAGPGTLLLKGPLARWAKAVARLVDGIEVVAMDPSLRQDAEEGGVSRMVSGPGIPFSSGTFKAALLSGEVREGDLGEALRVLAPMGRVILVEGPSDAKDWLENAGVRIILDQGGVLVGEQPGMGAQPLVTLRGT